MPGLTFQAWRDGVLLTLSDILSALGELVEDVQWRLNELECVGPGSEKVHLLSDTGTRVTSRELLALAQGGLQVIDAEIIGSKGREHAWITIRAIDSTSWDIETDDPWVLEAVRQMTPDADPLPE